MKNFPALLLLITIAFLPAAPVYAAMQQKDCIKSSKLSDEAAELAASNPGWQITGIDFDTVSAAMMPPAPGRSSCR